MKWCVTFPEETILVVRPSLTAICGGNKPAAKLLSVLLYRYSIRQESKEDAENMNEVKEARGETPNQDTSFSIYRKQAQLIDDMCGEISEKTLHDTAIPCLQLFGYLDIEELPGRNRYDVNLEQVTQALALYSSKQKSQPQLEKFLIRHLQLEKFLIEEKREKVLINKKNFLLALEKVLIANRKSSNCQRGRKPRPEAVSDGQNENPQISIEISNKITNKELSITVETPTPVVSAIAHADDTHAVSTSSASEKREKNTQKSAKQDTLLDTSNTPISEPDMTGQWTHEKVVQYVEWKHGKRFTVKTREAQLKAAQWLHQDNKGLTLEQFKTGYDERDDDWWYETKRTHPYVTDMKAKEPSSGMVRLYAMLERVESRKNAPAKSRKAPAPFVVKPVKSAIEQELDELSKGFNVIPREKLWEMPIEERRAYNRALDAHIQQQEAQQAMQA